MNWHLIRIGNGDSYQGDHNEPNVVHLQRHTIGQRNIHFPWPIFQFKVTTLIPIRTPKECKSDNEKLALGQLA